MSKAINMEQGPSTGSFKMLGAMVTIGLFCALGIVLTYEGTLPIIKKNKAEALERAIFKVVPGISTKSAYYLDESGAFIQGGEELEAAQKVYAGYDESGALKGMAIEASGIGFADIIRVLYGYDPEAQQIIGFYVLESKETPGLGDKIEKDQRFLDNFKALDASLNADKNGLANMIVPVKQGEKTQAWEVDGITGATISSRAIGNILGESMQEWGPKIYEQQAAFSKTTAERENN